MKQTRRERGLVLLFPALLLLVGYVYTSNSSLRREITARQEQIGKVRAAAPSLADVALQQAQVQKLRAEVQDWERRRDAARAELDVLAAGGGSVRGRGEAVAALNEMFQKHHLHVEEAGAAVVSGTDAVVPPGLSAILDCLKHSPKFRPPQLYKVKFVGRYPDVAGALRQVVEDGLAFPVQLKMDESNPNTEYRVWTLHVWLESFAPV